MDFLDIDFNYTKKLSGGKSSNIKNFDFNFEKTHSVEMVMASRRR